MDIKLIEILEKRRFNNIYLCIDYLLIAGYSLSESIILSKYLFKKDSLNLNLIDFNDEKISHFFEKLNKCKITSIDENFIYYTQNKQILFAHNIGNNSFWINKTYLYYIFDKKDFYTKYMFEIIKIFNKEFTYFNIKSITIFKNKISKIKSEFTI